MIRYALSGNLGNPPMHAPRPPPADSGGLFARLAKTRRGLASSLAGLFGGGAIDDALLDELHDQLLLADVGVGASEGIINRLRRDANAGEPGDLLDSLRAALADLLAPCEQPLVITETPFVILMVGVNGVGKTTTLAKLAARLQHENRKVMLAACDTFRAAAIEQLQTWGRRLDVPVIAQSHGADPAAVAHDACNAAHARAADVLLIDTAGRQHTHDGLMEQLKKIARVVRKANPTTPQFPGEILLTIDAGNGQNALSQATHFQQAVGLNGLCITKLDGSAKGGTVIALAERFQLPIRYIGTGQEPEDLHLFSADDFIQALLPEAVL